MIGETVGSYRVDAKLGEGGMGVVYVAVHPLLHKQAVVKFLHAHLSQNVEIVTRFFNEARSATMIKHPGIVDVFDFGHHASGCAFILMEFLDGESLASRIRSGLDLATTIAIGRQIANAVGAAHQHSIVHRDLKPDNIYLVPDPDAPGRVRVKILDFGIAKLALDDAGLKTQTTSVMGTPMYMSPEQCKSSAQVDHRADIYSVGCILYEMVSSRVPFAEASGSLAQIISAHMFETPPPLPSSVPEELRVTILKCLAKDPADRFVSLTALGDALAAAAGEPAAAVAVPPRIDAASSEPVKAHATTLSGATAEVIEHRPARRPMLAIGAVVAAAAIGGILYAATRGGDAPSPEPTSAPLAAVVPDAAVSSPPKKITYRIESTPDGVSVYRFVDGLRVGKTPFSQSLEPTTGVAIYVLKLDGFEDTRVEIATDRDSVERITLDPLRVAKPVATRPVPAQPTNKPATKPVPPASEPKPPRPEPTTGTLRPKYTPAGSDSN